MKKIIIAGDSWGCGEWGWDGDLDSYDPEEDWCRFYNIVKGDSWPNVPKFSNLDSLPPNILEELKLFGFDGISSLSKSIGTHVVLHKGLEQYFIDDGFPVINISIGNDSNFSIINRLSNLVSGKEDDFLIIWIQTDPLRDLRPYKDFKNKFKTYSQILDYQTQHLYNAYAKLDALNTPIICLGGCSKLDMVQIKKFTNLNPLIPSIIEWLISQYTMPTTYCSFVSAEVTFSDWTNLIGKQFDLDSLDKLVYNKKIQDSLRDYPEFFWPDGAHPNRKALKLVYENILKNENLS
jgi:hypothetical protein